jgi:hypothetical protein
MMMQTGRTTRLLQEAVSLAKEGKRVFVVSVGNTLLRGLCSFPPELKEALRRFPPSPPAGVRVGKGSVVFINSSSDVINWENLTLRGYKDYVLLVDHYTIEQKFKPHLEMLFRYNSSGTGQPKGEERP